MSESDRLGPLLKNLTNSYMGVSEGDGLADRLSLAELDAAAKRSFPLCMKALYVARCMLPNAHSRSAWRRCTHTRMHGQAIRTSHSDAAQNGPNCVAFFAVYSVYRTS